MKNKRELIAKLNNIFKTSKISAPLGRRVDPAQVLSMLLWARFNADSDDEKDLFQNILMARYVYKTQVKPPMEGQQPDTSQDETISQLQKVYADAFSSEEDNDAGDI